MMKMILNASAVRELISIEPETTVELAKNAAEQVANSMTKILNSTEKRKGIETAINDYLNRILSERLSWRTNGINATYAIVIEDAIRARAKQVFDDMVNDFIRGMIDAELGRMFNTRLESFEEHIETKIDEMLRRRFARMFGGDHG